MRQPRAKSDAFILILRTELTWPCAVYLWLRENGWTLVILPVNYLPTSNPFLLGCPSRTSYIPLGSPGSILVFSILVTYQATHAQLSKTENYIGRLHLNLF